MTEYEKQRNNEPPKTLFLQPDMSTCFLNSISPTGEATPEAYYETITNSYANVCFSTYPVLNGEKFGKPIADCTSAMVFKDFAVFCIADGCGMGRRPALSARVACEKFTEYVVAEVPKTRTLAKAEKCVVKAVAYAQTMILQTEEIPTDAGLTTFLGVVVLRTGTSYALVYISVGDCRGLLIDKSHATINELVNDYIGRVDVQSAGGRLGPADGEYPEVTNLRCGITFCSTGTTLVFMSDGVCDNFDIRTQFASPRECNINGDIWCDDDKKQWAQRQTNMYSTLQTLFSEDSLESLCSNVYHFIIQKTRKARDAKVTKADGFVPGKMDHSTFVSVRLTEALFTESNVKKVLMIVPDDLRQ